MTWRFSAVAVLALSIAATPARALAWDWFHSPNENLEQGNALLKKGKAEAALKAYGAAARELPDSAGVHLNRGLALSKLGKLDEARTAFELATRSKGDANLRSDSYYNLGRTFLAGADKLAGGDDLEGAQGQLREAKDAFAKALRNRPGNRDAAWNLELVQRRLVELEKEKKKREQEKQEQEKQDQDEQEQGEGEQDQDKQDQDKQDQDKQDQDKQDQDKQGQDKQQGQDEDSKPPQQDPQKDGAKPPQPKPEQGQEPQPQPAEGQPNKPPGEALPRHMQQVLDALQDGEENLQKHRAQTRARQRPRRVEKDW